MAIRARGKSKSTDDLWLDFDGKAASAGATMILRPSIDPSTEVEIAPSDVRIAGDRTAVRIGGRAIRVTIPERSPFREGTRVIDAGRRRCGKAGSACIGGVEICCESGEIVGRCAGIWCC